MDWPSFDLPYHDFFALYFSAILVLSQPFSFHPASGPSLCSSIGTKCLFSPPVTWLTSFLPPDLKSIVLFWRKPSLNPSCNFTIVSRLFHSCMISLLRRKWQPTPVFLPGEFHGLRSLAGYNPLLFSHSVVTLCNPRDCITPGYPVLHYLLKLAQIHVHWVSDSIQPSHPLTPSSPFAFNLSQHQSLFQWVSSLHHVTSQSIGVSASASVLPVNT